MVPMLRFQMSRRLIMGRGAVAELPAILDKLDVRRPLLVTDRGLVEAGLCRRVRGVIEAGGAACAVFDGVEPDPRLEIVAACVDAARAERCDGFIGLGGGSSLDIAKVSAIVQAHGGRAADYVGIDQTPGRGRPTVMIPTTAGTGSEVTPIAVLSDKQAQLKKGVVSEHLYPDAAVIDPELAVSLPPHVTAFTGIDTLTHAIEAYTNKHAHPFVDVLALEAVRLVARHLRRAVATGDDLAAREGMARASLLGGMCLGSVNTAAVHALAYPLGGTYDVPHGVANSLLLPYVMRFNLPSDPAKFADLAAALGEDAAGRSPEQAGERAIEAVVRLSADVGIVSRLRDLAIPEDGIDAMAEAAMKVTRLLNNNPRPVRVDDARAIYRSAY